MLASPVSDSDGEGDDSSDMDAEAVGELGRMASVVVGSADRVEVSRRLGARVGHDRLMERRFCERGEAK